MNLNKVMQAGRLTRDPELTYTPNNTAICKFSLAVNHVFTKDGQKKEEVTYLDCEAWSQVGENINQYVRKGDPLYIEGRLKQDRWEDKDGNKRSKVKITVVSFQFLKQRDPNEGGQQQGRGQQRAPQQRQQQRPQPQQGNHQPVSDDDIPF